MKRFFCLIGVVFTAQTAFAISNISWGTTPTSVNAGQTYTVTAQCTTTGGAGVEVYIYKNGTFVAYAYGASSATATTNQTDYGSTTIAYTADAFDGWDGYRNSSRNVTVIPTNVAPSNTLTSPSAQTITVGTALTITSNATDPDGNITTHNLDIQRPDGSWNWQGGFAYGEPYMGGPVGSGSNSTRSASFTFNQIGTWNVRSWVNDSNGASTHSNTVSITVTQASQTITFPNPGTKHRDANSIALSASASSGLTVSFSVLSGPASVSGNTLTFTGTGNVTVRASQAGNATYAAAPSVDQTFLINANPSVTQSILDSAGTILASMTVSSGAASGSASHTIYFGQSWRMRVSGADSNGNLNGIYLRLQRPGSIQGVNPSPTDLIWSGTSYYYLNYGVSPTSSASYTTGTMVADQVGTWTLWSHVSDVPALGWGSVSPWSGNQWGWQSSGSAPSLVVAKATPTATFVSRTFYPTGPTYTVQASDLNAVFANPYSTAVAAPSGAVTYTLVSDSSSVSAGTVLTAAATYTVRASFAGDGNYNARTIDAVWTISAPPGDADNDGVPDAIEQQLGTNQNAAKENDSTNQTQLNIHRPKL